MLCSSYVRSIKFSSGWENANILIIEINFVGSLNFIQRGICPAVNVFLSPTLVCSVLIDRNMKIIFYVYHGSESVYLGRVSSSGGGGGGGGASPSKHPASPKKKERKKH